MNIQEVPQVEALFNYEILEASIQQWLIGQTSEINALIDDAQESLFIIGEKLIAVKNKLQHGEFEAWLQQELRLPRQSAWRMMNVVRKCAHLNGHNLSRTVLFELSSGTTPEEVKGCVQDKISKGEPVTAKQVKDLKNRYHKKEPAVIGTKLRVHLTSDPDDWTTPKEIVALAIKHFGEIDLDPCSNSYDNPNIPAKKCFVKPRKEGELRDYEDGLGRDWTGKMLVNPPYGEELHRWVDYLCQQYETGHVSEAILLIPVQSDTAWFYRLREYQRCFIRGRLTFGNATDSPPFPSMLVYLGTRPDRFAVTFRELGDTYQRIPYEMNYEKVT